LNVSVPVGGVGVCADATTATATATAATPAPAATSLRLIVDLLGWVRRGAYPRFARAQAGYPARRNASEGEAMPTRNAGEGILADAQIDARERIIELLKQAYWMEIETVMSYITNSVNPDGVRAQEIIESLREDIQAELGHAQQFAQRIKELYGVVPGSLEFKAEQTYLQPPERQTDIVHVIKGVIEAETGAIEHYNRIIEETEGVDPVTNDMMIQILHDEEGHRRLFEGFLREYEAEGLA
jgi:bacterioferritin